MDSPNSEIVVPGQPEPPPIAVNSAEPGVSSPESASEEPATAAPQQHPAPSFAADIVAGERPFAVVDENAEPTYKISIDALTAINGPPRQMVRCGTRSIYVWGKDRLRVTAAGSPAPAAPQQR